MLRSRVQSYLIGITAMLLVAAAAPLALAQGQVTQTTTVSNNNSSSGEGGIGVSLLVGPLFSTLSSDAITSPLDTKVGWIGGVEIGGNRPGILGVGVDVLYAKRKVGTPYGDANLNYVDVPVFMRINFGSSHRSGVNVFGLVGPDFNWLLNDTLNFSSSVSAQTQGFDVGFVGGVGIEITRFIIEGRYMKGFRSIAKDLSGSQAITSHSFALMVGVRLN